MDIKDIDEIELLLSFENLQELCKKIKIKVGEVKYSIHPEDLKLELDTRKGCLSLDFHLNREKYENSTFNACR